MHSFHRRERQQRDAISGTKLPNTPSYLASKHREADSRYIPSLGRLGGGGQTGRLSMPMPEQASKDHPHHSCCQNSHASKARLTAVLQTWPQRGVVKYLA